MLMKKILEKNSGRTSARISARISENRRIVSPKKFFEKKERKKIPENKRKIVIKNISEKKTESIFKKIIKENSNDVRYTNLVSGWYNNKQLFKNTFNSNKNDLEEIAEYFVEERNIDLNTFSIPDIDFVSYDKYDWEKEYGGEYENSGDEEMIKCKSGNVYILYS